MYPSRSDPRNGNALTDEKRGTSYADAGVSLEAGAEAVARYRDAVESTSIPGVLGGIGGFGGLFALRDAGLTLDDPVLVSATDGVGTKLRLAFDLGIHRTIGQDCVAMCVNDIVVTGARPLFFLDYLATGRLDPDQAAEIVVGIAAACRESGCALIGGETAEMPGFYADGEYDVAGFCVGIAERSALLDRARVQAGDVVVGLRSSGFHSNGYSLVRRIVADAGLDLAAPFESSTLGAALLEPTRLYPAAFSALTTTGIRPKSAAHITGGGFYENLPRALPDGLGATIEAGWSVPRIITHIADLGEVEARERWSVFNMGIGMCLILAPDDAQRALSALAGAGFEALTIGSVDGTAGIRIAGID